MSRDTVAAKIMVSGRVQGVWYRGWTVETASALGVGGWVRNRRDGRVEMLLVGDGQAVQTMIERLHDGPPAARVDRVAAEAIEVPDAAPTHFESLPTIA